MIKHAWRLLLALMLWNGQLCAQTTSSMLSFEERVFDFGEIQEKDGKVSHVFTFQNTSKTPVVISDVVSGCGCTGHTYSKEPVPPGQTSRITITFNPNYRPGFFSKEIVIFSNNRKDSNRVWIKGTVIPGEHPVEEDYPYYFGSGLYFNLKVLPFGKVITGQEKQIKLRYANDSDETITLSLMLEGNQKYIRFTSPGLIQARERGEILFSCRLDDSAIGGDIKLMVYPIINNKKSAEPLEVRMTGME